MIHCALPPRPPLHPSTPPPDLLINILVGLQMASLGQGLTPSGSLSYSPSVFSPFFSTVIGCLFFLFALSSFSPPPPVCLISSSSLVATAFLALLPSVLSSVSVPSHLSLSRPMPSLRLSQLVNGVIPSSLLSSSPSATPLTFQHMSDSFIASFSIHLISPGLHHLTGLLSLLLTPPLPGATIFYHHCFFFFLIHLKMCPTLV